MNLADLKTLLREKDPRFWADLRRMTGEATEFDDLIVLSSLRKKALARGFEPAAKSGQTVRLAILGGYSLYPLHELLVHFLAVEGIGCELLVGDYDNYAAEIMEPESALYHFRPQVVFLVPSARRCRHAGELADTSAEARAAGRAAAEAVASDLLALCRIAHERTSAEILLGNFMLPARHDLGAFRSRTTVSDWTFRKLVNLELGLNVPSFVRICDFEFLANRAGALAAEDARGWFESKQPASPKLLVDICREAARLIVGVRTPPKKVLVLDLDNTLWGGVIADDGLEGIEIGDTSPRGEAFKAFQQSILSLKQRGILLAVCSKNDLARAREPFERHPEMVLREEDFVSFKANWEPKSDNLRAMSEEIGLGLDSFVFVDDNAAEVEIVRQFVPAVSTILLGPDPADFVGQLQDCRLFEPSSITVEDTARARQYLAEGERRAAQGAAADMDSYLKSLEMEGVVREFDAVDVPRLAQLINKSNQFNLTTRRRTEAEVVGLIGRADCVCLSMRLRDRFGDHGLISIVIGLVRGDTLDLDTWLMSCRVLKRQVEETLLNEVARAAQAKGCGRIQGVYVATAKNEMVRDFYPRMGFRPARVTADRGEFFLDLKSFRPTATKVTLRPAHESK